MRSLEIRTKRIFNNLRDELHIDFLTQCVIIMQTRWPHPLPFASFPNFDKIDSFLKLVLNHFVKSVLIRSFSGSYFPAFGLNTERYFVSLRIQSDCRKIRTRITPNTDTFYAVNIFILRNSIVGWGRRLLNRGLVSCIKSIDLGAL